ncbi:major facilitator superfamily domain-containing protein [Pavlovales sp. CCMP2436]|nr:major facilitator superfamily domain-containing protein [Pavlovales sp. CCMP2436]
MSSMRGTPHWMMQRPKVDAKYVLVLSIFLDLLSVSLVVPSLPGRYRELGLTGWWFGAMGSLYSLTQIIGGVTLGFASDGALGRRGLLLVSFAGAALSYAMVAGARTLGTIMLSRVIVGLTKQSVTAVSALMTEVTASGAERASWLAHITCASTLSWAIGSALGGFLSTFSPSLPEVVAVLLYGVNALLVAAGAATGGHTQPDAAKAKVKVEAEPRRLSSNFAAVLGNSKVLRVLSVQLSRVLVVKALGSTSDMYELDRWSLSTVEIGLLRSYKSVAVLGVQEP